MKLGIMQPYFLPYIGYFQLLNAVDTFVIYDNIEYTKKGWINRNRIIQNGKPLYVTIPIRKDSDFLDIGQRVIADNSQTHKRKLLNKINGAYAMAPYFNEVFPVLERILLNESTNLFEYIYASLIELITYLEIETELLISSKLTLDHDLAGQNRVLDICGTLDANEYINPIGGTTLYRSDAFSECGIELSFLKCNSFEYAQFNEDFIQNLSIIDVLMFNSKSKVQILLNEFELFKS